ncbi:hypothetical protein ACETRX_34995 [Labrys portucalensis]|uniref:Uncharacterized protein n=1 Tax=Labrys neptuniae TaxID=376174 RepID=A0ABV6ZRN8_9HYPH
MARTVAAISEPPPGNARQTRPGFVDLDTGTYAFVQAIDALVQEIDLLGHFQQSDQSKVRQRVISVSHQAG